MPINACGHRVRRLLRDLNKRCGGNAVHLRVYHCEAGSPILSEAQVGVVHIRLHFAKRDETLNAALDRLSELKKKAKGAVII